MDLPDEVRAGGVASHELKDLQLKDTVAGVSITTSVSVFAAICLRSRRCVL